jgi:hypothetical protein
MLRDVPRLHWSRLHEPPLLQCHAGGPQQPAGDADGVQNAAERTENGPVDESLFVSTWPQSVAATSVVAF